MDATVGIIDRLLGGKGKRNLKSMNRDLTDIEVALHSELYEREVEMKKEGSRIIKEAEKIDDYEAYHKRLAGFMDTYNELGTAALTQYIMHRKIILEFLKDA